MEKEEYSYICTYIHIFQQEATVLSLAYKITV